MNMRESTDRIPVSTPHAVSLPPFSQAIITDRLVFTCGQVGENPETGARPEVFADEVNQVIDNLEQILLAAGSSLDRVVKTLCILRDISDMAAFNEVYMSRFDEPRPARSTIGGMLGGDFRVEIECVALLGDSA